MSNPNKVARKSAKSALTRFINHFNTVVQAENPNISDLQSRLNKAEGLLDLFYDAQLKIEIDDPSCEENYETIHANERKTFEDNYFEIISRVQSYISSKLTSSSHDGLSTSGDSSAAKNINVQLPPLKLPSFDGSLDQWLFFRDSFLSIIHKNDEISDVQKFHYLRLSLSGSAAELIKSLQVCNDNYKLAWDLLTERFENKQLLVNFHIRSLFNLNALTKESRNGLRQLLDDTQKHLRALEVLKRPTSHWDDIIIYLTSSKLDNITRRAWESQNKSGNLPTLSELIAFLNDRCRILETLDYSTESKNSHSSHYQKTCDKNRHQPSKIFHINNNIDKNTCLLCKQQHTIYACPDFVKLNPHGRLGTAKRLRLCINCLGSDHSTRECSSSGCRRCGNIHHTMLHFQSSNKLLKNTPPNDINKDNIPLSSSLNNSSNTASQDHTSNLHSNNNPDTSSRSQILLSTACVNVYDKFGKSHVCRVLLDNGSQSNFISERLCNILQLPLSKVQTSVSGINETSQNVNSVVTVTFKSTINNYERNISCLVLPKITGNLPYTSINTSSLNIPEKLPLADPNFGYSAPIDLLVGADTFWDLLCIGQLKLGQGLPILHKTKLGWIISGPIFSTQNTQRCYLSTFSNLENQLVKFWEIEEPPKAKTVSVEEAYCQTHYNETVTQASDGHFTVNIPLKHPPSILGDSRISAAKRFYTLERKLSKNQTIQFQYHNFIQEYIDLGHMSLAEDQNDDTGFFLPHHCVLKDTSSTTKLRVVFDGSLKTDSGYSLNDIMLIGPNIQDDLFSILLRFRLHNFVLSADIAKMYRQIWVDKDQRYLQKILWRFNSDDNLSVYCLNTVTYGTASAAFLAIRSLHEVGYKHAQQFPKLSSIILHDFYVDDLLTGCQTIEELKDIKNLLSSLLQSYGFCLRKWVSNFNLFTENDDNNILNFGDGLENKTLGLFWNSSTDHLKYSINNSVSRNKITKRHILSCTAQIFDPLGLLSPVTITAKIILQELWKLKISWDESVPTNLYTTWSRYRGELSLLNKLSIPRHVLCSNQVFFEIHGFCDASQTAYAACVYIRCVDSYDNITSNLYCSKTRVAPLKVVTIPRLELCAALLLSELVDKVISSFIYDINNITYWSDSTITLSWIKTSPHLLKTFIANRVSQIQTLTKQGSWRYISTLDNPADLPSRGMIPSDLLTSVLWFHGPSWLLLFETDWPSYIQEYETITLNELPEIRTHTETFFSTLDNFDIFSRFSSLTKLIRVFSYVLRFKNILPRESVKGPLTVEELDSSLIKLIQLSQQQVFPKEYYSLLNSKPISKRSKLASLNPFFDTTSNTMRVGGRLRNSQLAYDKKHPIILPPKHPLTNLIVRHYHIKLLHSGPQALLAAIREQYWPLSGRNLVKRIVHNCTTCFRFSTKPNKYLMGDLPDFRLTPTRPFLIIGIDYAGPFHLRDRKGRNFKITKAYIALFVCLASKAIHIEVVSDLTTDCFLSALRRFMSRRGKCVKIYTDNGTTFLGANNEIKRFFDIHNLEIDSALSNDGIEWHFIPPRSPHFGGIWEAGVKSVKYHLKRVMGNASLTFEDFSTVLCQIEACLNSRPLYPLSSDPSDPNPITPAHLLIGESLTTIPDHKYIDLNERHLSRYQRHQQLLQHFWARWSKEYVSSLQQRTKWKENIEQHIHPGTLVIVKEDGLPPLKWQVGRILEVHPGSDNVIRCVTIKTAGSKIKRPVKKIAVLPDQN